MRSFVYLRASCSFAINGIFRFYKRDYPIFPKKPGSTKKESSLDAPIGVAFAR